MVRWIAFDDETAEAVVSRFRRGAAEIQRGEPLDAALQMQRPSILVLPSEVNGQTVVAHVLPSSAAETVEAIQMEASGFLGLSDAPVSADRPQQIQKRKKWWRL